MSNADDSEKVIFGEPSTKEFSEKLWYCGHEVGQVNGQIIIENMPFLSQLKIGVLNNEGVQFSSNTFVSSKVRSSTRSKYLTDISQMREQLINHDKRVKHLDHS